MSVAGQVLWNRKEMGAFCALAMAGNPSAATPAAAAPEMNLRRRGFVTCCMACCLLGWTTWTSVLLLRLQGCGKDWLLRAIRCRLMRLMRNFGVIKPA